MLFRKKKISIEIKKFFFEDSGLHSKAMSSKPQETNPSVLSILKQRNTTFVFLCMA